MARGKYIRSYWDYDKENSTATIPTVEIDEVNLVVQSGFMDVLAIALDAVSIGVPFKDTRVFIHSTLSDTPPSSKLSQRENKWVVQMREADTFDPFTMTIPCADLTLLDDDNRGVMDKGLSEYTNLKTAIEQIYLTKLSKAVVVGDIVFAGRNL